jgi:hypothetical protein
MSLVDRDCPIVDWDRRVAIETANWRLRFSIANHQPRPVVNRQCNHQLTMQSSIVNADRQFHNLKQRSAISNPAIGNRQSAIAKQ